MARLYKQSLEYFSFDVNLDTKFDLIEAEFGLTGFAVIVKLFQKIYGGQGYYCEWTNEVALLFSRKLGFSDGGSAVSEILTAAIRRGIFDKNLYDKYHVLTSKGIQKRYFEAVSRRKEIEVDNNILLINVTHLCVNANINSKNVDINSKNVDINSQSKVKESKVKESKVVGRPAAAALLKFYQQNIGSISPHTAEMIEDYVDLMCEEAVQYALEQAVEHDSKNHGYIQAICKSLLAKGVKTPADLLSYKKEWSKTKSTQKSGGTQKNDDYIKANDKVTNKVTKSAFNDFYGG